jgi:hypothetical protein
MSLSASRGNLSVKIPFASRYRSGVGRPQGVAVTRASLLPAQAPRARRPIRCPPGQARAIPVRPVARYAADSSEQRGDHCGSQQAGSHRPGRSIKRPGLSRSGKLRDCLIRCGKDAFGLEALIGLPLYRTTTTRSSPTKVCTGQLRRTNSSQRRACNLLPKMVSMTVPFIRKSTQRNSSWPGDSALHPKANTFAQTCRSAFAFPLQPRGGPYICGN